MNLKPTQTNKIQSRPWILIGVGSGWGAGDMRTADGPRTLLKHLPDDFKKYPEIDCYWHQSPLTIASVGPLSATKAKIHNDNIYEMANYLSRLTKKSVLEGSLPLVLGGDHSIAIGTWSGIKAAVGEEDMALIWIDAHLDANTPTTSPSLNMHGMPVAVLLGQGEARFTNLCGPSPKIKPENIYLIGIRSFDEGEEQLLKKMGVSIYFMKEVQESGFDVIFQEVLAKIGKLKFGLTIDVDAFDPQEAPGTGTPETGGLCFEETRRTLYQLAKNPQFLGLEIAEFNAYLDNERITLNLIWNLVRTISGELV